jgi:hypothetical protein
VRRGEFARGIKKKISNNTLFSCLKIYLFFDAMQSMTLVKWQTMFGLLAIFCHLATFSPTE